MQNVSNLNQRRSMTHTDHQLQRIRQYQQDGASIIMLCDAFNLPEMHRLIIEEVRLDPDPSGPDIYPAQAGGRFHLHALGKLKFQRAAGIQWDPKLTGPQVSNKDYCHCAAVGFIQAEFGRAITFRGDAEMDMECIKEDLTDEYTKKARSQEKDQAYIDYCVNRDFRFKRTHKVKLTSTSAKGVVIDKLLNLKSSYTMDEIKRGFVVVRTIVAPDLSDQDTQRELKRITLGKVAGVYGPEQKLLTSSDTPDDDDNPPIDIPHEPVPDANRQPEPAPPSPAEPPEDEPDPALDFQNDDHQGKVRTIKKMAAQKGFNLGGLKKPVAQYSDNQLVHLFHQLLSMPDDDIPY